MQLNCPHCGQPVSAEHINIQRMAAVCPACHNVFQFDPSESKLKRRKIKRPQHITTDERNDQLNIAFRTNFRLDKNEAFLSGAVFSAIFTFMTVFIGAAFIGENESPILPLGFAVLTLVTYYWLALVAFNKTHIEVDDEKISVSRRPLPNFLSSPDTISLSNVETIRYEETTASKKEGYDTPRYNVWAESVEGKPKLVVGDVIEDYAVFISQRMNEYLDVEPEPDVNRLLDAERADEIITDDFPRQSQSQA